MLQLEKVNSLEVLQEAGWKYTPSGEHWIKGICPYPDHDDHSPSLSLNIQSNKFKCFACNKSGDIIDLLALITKSNRSAVKVYLKEQYDLEELKTVSSKIVNKYHDMLWDSGPFLKALRDRGVSDEALRKARIGFNGKRITIPVYNDGHCVNLRLYIPGGIGSNKMRNLTGFGKLAIYQLEQLKKYETIWLCGGEIKSLVGADLLNTRDIGAISTTGGEGSFDQKWVSLFRDKNVFICMDIDDPGKAAAAKLYRLLSNVCLNTGIIDLPLDKIKYPKGDLNDYVGKERATVDDLIALQVRARRISEDELKVPEPEVVSFGDISRPENVNKRLEFSALVIASEDRQYITPKTIRTECDLSNPLCNICPIFCIPKDKQGYADISINKDNKGLVSLALCLPRMLKNEIKTVIGIPKCDKVSIEVTAHYSLLETRIGPEVGIRCDSYSNSMKTAYMVDTNTEFNIPYAMSGVYFPSPKDNKEVILVYRVDSKSDSLRSFEMTPEDGTDLKVFQSGQGVEKVREKLNWIYEDIEQNVTRIYHRRAMHLLFDLTYHSCLNFRFNKKIVPGWVNSIIVGDTAQGKSEVANCLREHYGLGEKVDCGNASGPGIIGGVQNISGRWFITWGIVPMNDRGLVILEEAAKLDQEMICRMTDMRSSGIAEINKIERRRSNARTRIMMLSNPRDGRSVSEFNYGFSSVFSVMGKDEAALRRFDIATVLCKEDIDIVAAEHETEHILTKDLCHKLVLFAWTRGIDSIKFDQGVEHTIFMEARELSKMFSSAFPLVDAGTAPYKVARLSVALALRLFSVDEDLNVLVRSEHVEYISELLINIYSSPKFGYKRFSVYKQKRDTINDVDGLTRYLMTISNLEIIINVLKESDKFKREDIEDAGVTDSLIAKDIISKLLHFNCIVKSSTKDRSYRKTPKFIEYIHEGTFSNAAKSEI